MLFDGGRYATDIKSGYGKECINIRVVDIVIDMMIINIVYIDVGCNTHC